MAECTTTKNQAALRGRVGHHNSGGNADAGGRTSPLACWSASCPASRLAAWRPALGFDISGTAPCGCAWRRWSSRRRSSQLARWPLTQGDPSLHSRLVCERVGLQWQSATADHAAQHTQQALDSRQGCACSYTPLPCWWDCSKQHRHFGAGAGLSFTSSLLADSTRLVPRQSLPRLLVQ